MTRKDVKRHIRSTVAVPFQSVTAQHCGVSDIDYPRLRVGRALRATGERWGTKRAFRAGDAQNLPFPDDSFDVVLSVFGVQFAPDHEQVASELLRVCRPGGTIGLASPVPVGWTGDYFSTMGQYVPLPPGVKPAFRWGTKAGLDELLDVGVRTIETDARTNLGYFRSVDHAVKVFTTYFGPTATAMEVLKGDEREHLRDDITAIFRRHNRATDGTVKMECQYLQTIATCE